MRATQVGESHRDVREARSQLFALYTAWGRPEQAAAFSADTEAVGSS